MVDWLSRLLLSSSSTIPGFLSETLEVKEKAYRPSKKYESKSATTWLTLFCIIQLCNLCIHYPFHFELYSQQLSWELSKKERKLIFCQLFYFCFHFLNFWGGRRRHHHLHILRRSSLLLSLSWEEKQLLKKEILLLLPPHCHCFLKTSVSASGRRAEKTGKKQGDDLDLLKKERASFLLLPRCSLIF